MSKGNPHNYEAGFTIEQHRDELIDRLGKALSALAAKDAEIREEKARFYRIGFEDCRAQAMQVVDESDGYLSRIGGLEPTLTNSALSTVPEGEKP